MQRKIMSITPNCLNLSKNEIRFSQSGHVGGIKRVKPEKEIQDCEDKIRYGGSTPELCEKLTKCHSDWREAFENLEHTGPNWITHAKP